MSASSIALAGLLCSWNFPTRPRAGEAVRRQTAAVGQGGGGDQDQPGRGGRTLAKTLRALQGQIDEYRKQIEQAFSNHPDGGIFASLPAGGERFAPRILGEMGSDRRLFESAESLQCYAGTAPVTKKSGKSRYVGFRRACNMTLRTTLHLWADQSRHHCAWADACYQQKKAQGMGHAKALRCLGQRWLKIIWRMWQDHVPYDEARHMQSLSKSGSWVLGLLPKPAPAVPN